MVDPLRSPPSGRSAAPPQRRARGGNLLIASLLATLLLTAIAAGNNRDGLLIAFTNTATEVLEVSVDGDRLLVIPPEKTEYLLATVEVFASPRTIEVRRFPHGERLARWQADLADLGDANFRYRIH